MNKNRKDKKSQFKENDEKLLEDIEPQVDDTTKDIDEELILIGSKKGGQRRTNPQDQSTLDSNSTQLFKCRYCTVGLESKGLLNAHI